MERESFIFYQSFWRATKHLPKENQKNALLMIVEYGIDGKPPIPENDPIAYAIFLMAQPQIDINNKKFVVGSKQGKFGILGKEYGKLGGRPAKQKPPNIPPKNPPNVNVNVNDNVKENNKDIIYFENEKLNRTFLDFLDMRKKIKKIPTPRAIDLLIKKINNMTGGTEYKILCIEQSIMNNYQGIFDLNIKTQKPEIKSDYQRVKENKQDFGNKHVLDYFN